MELPDVWDEWHSERATEPTAAQRELRQMLVEALEPVSGKRVLELGCGQGSDAVWFAERGARVHAFDLSGVAVNRARATAESAGADVRLSVHDMGSGELPEFDCEFDGVYSHLSLHYFSESVTSQLVSEIARSTRAGGVLALAVKSVRDPMFGEGERVGDSVFRRKGKVRRFFTAQRVADLLHRDWDVLVLDEPCGSYQSEAPSAFVRALARRRREE